jgi:hypothetical protein
MSRRLGSLCLVILAIPLFSQQQNIDAQSQTWVWGRAKTMNSDPIPQLDPEAIRRKAIHDDAEALSTLSVALQSDLQQLRKGVLPKELAQDLKKVEKLSKKLRQEVAP